jgi:hypothetical protein
VVGAGARVAGAPGPFVSELQARGGMFLALASTTGNPLKIMSNRRDLERMVLDEGVELIHVRAGASLSAALKIAREARIPLVADYAAGRAEALDADTILVASASELDEARRLRPDVAKNLRQSLRGVDLRRFAAETVEFSRMGQLRDALGVKPHVRLVIGIDLPAECRGLFFAAAGALKARGFFANEAQEARLVWLESRQRLGNFGPGNFGLGDFEAECARAGLAGEAARLVWDDRAAACLASALVIVPSTAPQLCIEAQALGSALAVLHPPGVMEAGIKELPQPIPRPDGRPAQRGVWIVPVNQPQTLARACEEAVRLGASARESLARRARAHASGFSVERMCSLALAAYARHFQ